MDIVRKLGTAVVFIVPTFVFSGLVWDWFHSWAAVVVMTIIMALTYTSVIAGWPVAVHKKR
jgi:hypothetical protein